MKIFISNSTMTWGLLMMYSYFMISLVIGAETEEGKGAPPLPEVDTNTFLPLIFIRYPDGYQIIDLTNIPRYDLVYAIILACPAEGVNEILANQNKSLTKKSLFVRNIYKNYEDVDTNLRCTTPYEPSLIQTDNESYEIGYEVTPIMNSLDDLDNNSFYNKELQRLPRFMILNVVEKSLWNPMTWGHNYAKPTGQEIVWLTGLSISFTGTNDKRVLHVTQMTRYHDSIDKSSTSCPDSFSDANFNNRRAVLSLYALEHQNKIFKDFEFYDQIFTSLPNEISDDSPISRDPNHLTEPTGEAGISENPDTKPNFKLSNYLVYQELASSGNFYDYALKLETCAPTNNAPMWKSVAEGSWSKVNQVVKIIIEGVKKLKIITGNSGVLQLPSKGSKKKELLLQNQYPVPELFWKILKYPLYSYNHTLILHYFIVIVTHNNPFDEQPPEMLCEENVCRQNGLDLTNHDNLTGYTYCCRVSRDILQKLAIKEDFDGIDFNLKAVDLELNDKGFVMKTENFNETRFKQLVGA